MSDKFIPLSVPNLSGNEMDYVKEAVETEWVSTGGAFINDFEEAIASYTHAEGAVACQSGTAGLHLALMINGVCQGDEVIAPALTFIAAVNPIRYAGAHPVFMDCDDSLCIDMGKVEQFCREECSFRDGKLINNTTGKHIKAIVVVHVFGNMADMERVMSLAEAYNLKVIEDATEAIGTYVKEGKYKGSYAGVIGDTGVYSFNGNKIITTGGGGMIVSKDPALLKRAKYLSTQAKDDPLYYQHNEIGYNYRMTNLQAALGLAQLEQLEDFIVIKEKNYQRYAENGIALLPFEEWIRPNYWFYSYLTDRRDELIKYLQENGIQSRPIWNLICDLPPYKDEQRYQIEKARFYLEKIVNIPCSTNLLGEDVDRVADALKQFDNQ